MRRRIAWTITAVVAVVVAVAVVGLGFVGIAATAGGGAQTSVCGVRIGVLDLGDTATIGWGSERRSVAVGERVRIAPWCVLEVTGIRPATSDEDGGGRIDMIWRLW